jgi:hypothetical protein
MSIPVRSCSGRRSCSTCALGVFLSPSEKRESQGPSVKDMQAKIGQLALENDFLAGALGRIDGASAKK